MSNLPVNPTVVVLGAPRSGTSLLASWLHHSGVSMGSDFLAPDDGNPSGYYEDSDFLNLQRQFLARSAAKVGRLLEDSTLRDERFDRDLEEGDREAAHELVESRMSDGKPWGWKDPRTCYFLGFWDGLLPKAQYLLTYRHPLETCASLLRMGRNWDSLYDPLLPMRSWTYSMKEVLRFTNDLSASRSCIFATEAVLGDNSEQLASALLQKCHIALDIAVLPDLIGSGASRTKGEINQRQHMVFTKYFPLAAETFELLQERASFAVSLEGNVGDPDPILDYLEHEDVEPEIALYLLYDSIQPAMRSEHRSARRQLVQHVQEYTEQRFSAEVALRKAYQEQSAYTQNLIKEMDEYRKQYRELLEHSKKQKAHIENLTSSISDSIVSPKHGGHEHS